jgi:hypothetical protein
MGVTAVDTVTPQTIVLKFRLQRQWLLLLGVLVRQKLATHEAPVFPVADTRGNNNITH